MTDADLQSRIAAEAETRRILRDVTSAQSWAQAIEDFEWALPDDLNMAERCCDSWAEIDPNRTALIHILEEGGEEVWTYGGLMRASNRFANAMADLGVEPGDRVATLLPQGPAVLIAHLAAYKLGAIVLPLFTLFGPDALAYRLRDSGAKAVVTNDENLAKLEELRPELPEMNLVYSTGTALAPSLSFWEAINEASEDLAPFRTHPETPALLIYTSGTTGDPKGVLHGHGVLLGHIPAIELHHQGFPQPGDCGWTPADWAWIGGLMDMAMPCLYFGVPLISNRMRKFDAAEAYDLMARRGVRNVFLPPTALKLMRQVPVPSGVKLRSISSGGESLGAELMDWAQENLGAPVNELYGQTECNLVVNSAAGLGVQKPGAMGWAVPGHRVAILGADGAELPRGTAGEIAIAAPDPVMFLKYWNKPAETKQKRVDGWLRTGDLGRMDEAGYISFSSRDDDVITSSGYRIGPTEIEHCLNGHADVVMSAVIGVPDAARTERVKAFVVLRDGATWDGLEKALITRVRQKISPHVAPREVEKIESLPMTATGKIMRRALRDRAG